MMQRRLGLRHGAALVRLADNYTAAERLHTFLLAHPDVGGEEALRIAGQMLRAPDIAPEVARRQLQEDVQRRTLLRGMSESDTGSAAGAGFGLRASVGALANMDATQLSREERAQLTADVAAAIAALDRVQQDLDAAE